VYLEPFGRLEERYHGLARKHAIVLDLGPFAPDAPVTLVLTGWPDWTSSTVNYAAAQNPALAPMSPRLEVIGADGRWKTVVQDMGLPAGMDKTMLVDLTGAFATDDHRVRITTNLTIYWDQILVGVPRPDVELRRTVLEPAAAELRFRGYSRFRYVKGRVGPVRSLLTEADDCYVIFDHGDEVAVEFAADRVPPLPAGWARTFFVHVVGWIKDGDFHTRDSQTVEPLPSLSGAGYPDDEHHRRYRQTFNRRLVPSPTALGLLLTSQ